MIKIYTLLILLLFAQSLVAKEDKYLLSRVVYDGIAKVQEYIEKDKYTEAKNILLELERSKNVKKTLDKAYIRFYIGYFYNLRDDAPKAILYFEEALSLKALPPEQIKSSYLNLVQLYMNSENYNKSITYLDKLMTQTSPVKVEYFVYKANAYLALKEYEKVIESLNRAISFSKKVKPNWIKTKFYCYYVLKNYPKAIESVKKLIELEPKNKEYWLQLSSLYSVENNFSEALSSLDVARIALIELNENELLQLISWLRNMNIPYKAATIMQSKLENKTIKSNEKNMEFLGDLYYEAKEFKNAIIWYSKAAKISDRGKLYFKIAQLYANAYNSEEVVKSINLSLKKEDEDNLGEKKLLLAKAYYDLGHIKEAKQTFNEALKYKKSKKTALVWLSYLNR